MDVFIVYDSMKVLCSTHVQAMEFTVSGSPRE